MPTGQQQNILQDIAELRHVREASLELGEAASLRIPLSRSTCRLYRVRCLTYEKDFPRQEAFENVVASINNVACRLVYYLRGTDGGVEFYIGVVDMGIDGSLNIGDYGNMLSRAFRGNFLGSQLQELDETDTGHILSSLRDPQVEYSRLLGVPTRNSQREDIAFQGVDRPVNIMTSGGNSLGQNFHLLVVWEPVATEDVIVYEQQAMELYSSLAPMAKQNVTQGSGDSEQHGSSTQDSTSSGTSTGESQSTSESEQHGTSTQDSTSSGTSTGKSQSTSNSEQHGTSTQDSTSSGTSTGESQSSSNSEQHGTSTQDSTTTGKTEGRSKTTTSNKDTSHTQNGGTSESSTHGKSSSSSWNRGNSITSTSGSSQSTSHGEGSSPGWSRGSSTSTSSGSSQSTSHGTSSSTAITTSRNEDVSWEEHCKFVQDAMECLKEEILPRFRRGKAKGMYKTAVYVGAETSLNRSLLENALLSICQGDKPTFTPLYARPLPRNAAAQALISSLNIRDHLKTDATLLLLDSRPVVQGTVSLATWLTAAEISMLAGFPQKEVPGLELRQQVAFGLNIGSPTSEDKLELGHMMQEGSHLKGRRVCLDRRELSKHIFIAGTTGSGKTTTCHKLLASSSASRQALPFLVVEPAKTEYRVLLRDPLFAEAVLFTLGNEEGVPFRFNPFEFLPEESLSGHVDLLKACFMASFDMEAAIPNLLEEGLYRTYEAYGWNFRNSSNRYLTHREDAWNSDGRYFPTISSYIDVILQLVDEKGFDARLRDEYKGSIRARLDSLRAGAKGLMLDTPLSVDFMELLDKQVLLELEGLKSGEDKAFLMGLVLGRMTEALKIRHSNDKTFRHITLIEEAHRLLTRPLPGDSPNRRLGVETFTDLLAEVRKYGESLIIVDQIPSKLAPEVLKNTNTKIIHKLFARDDKDVVGDTMALDDKQKSYLSHLEPGEAIIFTQGWKKPVDVQVEALPGIATDDDTVSQDVLMEKGWAYWLDRPQRFCPGLSTSMWKKPLPRLAKTLRDIEQHKEALWEAWQGKTDWRVPFHALRERLGEQADALVLALLSAWEMRMPHPDAAARQALFAEGLPAFVKKLSTASDDDWKQYANDVEKRIF